MYPNIATNVEELKTLYSALPKEDFSKHWDALQAAKSGMRTVGDPSKRGMSLEELYAALTVEELTQHVEAATWAKDATNRITTLAEAVKDLRALSEATDIPGVKSRLSNPNGYGASDREHAETVWNVLNNDKPLAKYLRSFVAGVHRRFKFLTNQNEHNQWALGLGVTVFHNGYPGAAWRYEVWFTFLMWALGIHLCPTEKRIVDKAVGRGIVARSEDGEQVIIGNKTITTEDTLALDEANERP